MSRRIMRAGQSRVPFIMALLVVIAAGLIVYFSVSGSGNERPVKLALVTWNQDPFWDPVIRGAEAAGREFNAQVEIVKSRPDLESQNADLRKLTEKGIQGVGLSANDPGQQAQLIKDTAARCPVVMFDVDAPDSPRKVFVGIDNYSAGHFAADELRSALPDGGGVIITVGSNDMPHGRERRQGVIDGLLDRRYQLDPPIDPVEGLLIGEKYTVVATIVDHGDAELSTRLLAEALKAHPEVKGVVALFSYSGGAALKAIEQAGRARQVKMVAFDDSEDVQAGIRDGRIAASILQDTYRMGNETIRLLASEVRSPGAETPSGSRKVLVQIDVIRQDNIDQMHSEGRIRAVNGSTTQPRS